MTTKQMNTTCIFSQKSSLILIGKIQSFEMNYIKWLIGGSIRGLTGSGLMRFLILKRNLDSRSTKPRKKKYVPSIEGHRIVTGFTFSQGIKAKTFANYDIMTVGEANGVSVDEADKWVGENGEFNMIFQFEHLDLWGKNTTWSGYPCVKKTITKWQKGSKVSGWNALFLENHDQPRSVSTWGNE